MLDFHNGGVGTLSPRVSEGDRDSKVVLRQAEGSEARRDDLQEPAQNLQENYRNRHGRDVSVEGQHMPTLE